MMVSLKLKTKDGERLFDIVTDVTHPIESQLRNYVERSVSTLKKFIREACGLTRNESFPTLKGVKRSCCLSVKPDYATTYPMGRP